jgi:glyoxalase superfamily protein
VSIEVTWLSVFADVPAGCFAASRSFWEQATATTAGPAEGDTGEFTPLEPGAGDRYLWLQRVARADGGWHPDLHVRDPGAATRQATQLGARAVRSTPELVVLESPGGQPFCVVADDAQRLRRRPPVPSWPAGRSLADQLCLDIPADRYDAECAFWAAFFGWPLRRTDAAEFRRLNPPGDLPVQFLLQRLGADDPRGPRAHLDMSADDRDGESRRHRALGATVVRVTEGWTTLRDPAGLIYCITGRRPGDPVR